MWLQRQVESKRIVEVGQLGRGDPANPARGFMNTGNDAFVDNPVYISNADGGSMTFYAPTTPSP